MDELTLSNDIEEITAKMHKVAKFNGVCNIHSDQNRIPVPCSNYSVKSKYSVKLELIILLINKTEFRSQSSNYSVKSKYSVKLEYSVKSDLIILVTNKSGAVVKSG